MEELKSQTRLKTSKFHNSIFSAVVGGVSVVVNILGLTYRTSHPELQDTFLCNLTTLTKNQTLLECSFPAHDFTLSLCSIFTACLVVDILLQFYTLCAGIGCCRSKWMKQVKGIFK